MAAIETQGPESLAAAQRMLTRLAARDVWAATVEGLGEFFPSPAGLGWLEEGQTDASFAPAFASPEDEHGGGGWLKQDAYNRFWATVGQYHQLEAGGDVPDGFLDSTAGPVTAEVLQEWREAAAAPPAAQTQGGAAGRYVSVEPVGDQYPGWWQGYDSHEQVWKYTKSGHEAPGDDAPDWRLSDQVPWATEGQAAAASTTASAAVTGATAPAEPAAQGSWDAQWQMFLRPKDSGYEFAWPAVHGDPSSGPDGNWLTAEQAEAAWHGKQQQTSPATTATPAGPSGDSSSDSSSDPDADLRKLGEELETYITAHMPQRLNGDARGQDAFRAAVKEQIRRSAQSQEARA